MQGARMAAEIAYFDDFYRIFRPNPQRFQGPIHAPFQPEDLLRGIRDRYQKPAARESPGGSNEPAFISISGRAGCIPIGNAPTLAETM